MYPHKLYRLETKNKIKNKDRLYLSLLSQNTLFDSAKTVKSHESDLPSIISVGCFCFRFDNHFQKACFITTRRNDCSKTERIITYYTIIEI